jgi:hypothetical protein
VLRSCHVTILVGDLFHSLIFVLNRGTFWKARGGDQFMLLHFLVSGRAVVLQCCESESESGSPMLLMNCIVRQCKDSISS